jgi:anti-anti-sigma factor
MRDGENFAISLDTSNDRFVVRLWGELSRETAPDLLDQMRAWLAAAAVPISSRVELCLDGLTFCDSNGIAVLLRVAADTCHAGHGVVLRHPRPLARRALDIADVGSVVAVEDGASDLATTAASP